MTTRRSQYLLVIVWLITGILCIAAGIRLLVVYGYTSRILVFFIMAVVSFLFAWFRNRQRKKS